MNKAKEQLEKFKQEQLKKKEIPKEESNEENESIIRDFWLYVTQEYFWYTYLGFGIVYLICFLMFLMFLNMGKRKKGEVSAYSVFNENFEALPGQMTAEQFEEAMLKRKKLN
ncbi:Uncharacterised domain SAYSvFN-containing protein [Strongyloides ratti]|uniref:Uncharacterized domain SAYSvFN-containing protein n=1 Tax=Strongyloides ratti TaxID=34506 RepID=A0A090LRQ4_STRRB|nr:Uncharacterised domain SAYSvFN-containing protein [Strongyloides ratti]CEF70246.1 Uncharacterised domain SAYSvFN-containing protein [Strongyloides ratti]